MNILGPWIPRSAALLVAIAAGAPAGQTTIEFTRDIQPILQKSCIRCHGPDKQKGKLRLDLKVEAFREPSILAPGKADQSELYRRIILPPDHDDFMPAEGDPLTPGQTELIRDWINQGAAWLEDPATKTASPADPSPDLRLPLKPSPAEQAAVARLHEMGVALRPVAIGVPWTQATFRGLDPSTAESALPLLTAVLTLEDLNLAGLPLRDEQLQHIAGLTNLTRLHLEKTPISDGGLAHLKGLVHLRYLNLYGTRVSDAGLVHLQGMRQLKHLYLWQTKVTSEGAKNLQTILGQAEINRGWETSVVQTEQQTEPKGKAQKPGSK